MKNFPSETSMMTLKIKVPTVLKDRLIEWQTKLNGVITGFPGFVSLEILSPGKAKSIDWSIVLRFLDPKSFQQWKDSSENRQLMEELKKLLSKDPISEIKESTVEDLQLHGNVTEVFVTEVAPEKEEAYREWMAKIHNAEAKFPGFRGTYVQSPRQGQGRNWITLLQFDSPKSLDNWLSSPERAEVLKESVPLVSYLESHRVISPYAGWFARAAQKGELPPVWKQTMIVLLVLFPIVMFELKYLNPWLAPLNSSIATFIGNAISVTLISWPLMPIAIRYLGWWLSPVEEKSCRKMTILGTGFILLLYLIEIVFFWNFF